MKRRMVSVLLACVLVLGLACPALAAPAFTDLVSADGRPHWAKDYIERLAARGLFEGYGDGRVGPNDNVVNSAALALCARMAVQDEELRLQIGADRHSEVTPLLTREGYTWFEKEAATCLELGIVNYNELTRMAAVGAAEDGFRVNTTREEFTRYVIRAMGLEDLTRTLSGAGLTCVDAEDITPELRPYVRLAYLWGVVNGVNETNEQGELANYFHPGQPITRAECATMLERAITKMEERGVLVEIPRYTKYKSVSGYIAGVEPNNTGDRTLTLSSPFEAVSDTVLTLPAKTSIYLYNKLDDYPSLRVGTYARVCMAEDGVTPESIRLMPESLIASRAGSCDELTTTSVVVDGDLYTLDRFTQVSAGGKVGDVSVIDYSAQYTTAVLAADQSGRVLHLALSGGTREREGILAAVTTTALAGEVKTAITVTDYAGVSRVYDVPAAAAVTVLGGESTLRPALEGRHIALRVRDTDSNAIESLTVNGVEQYVQGALVTVDKVNTPTTVVLVPVGVGQNTRYTVANGCAVLFQDKESTLDDLKGSVFVTAKLEGGTVTRLWAYPGSVTTEGTLTSITYGDPTILRVTQADGTVASFSIPTAKLGGVTVTRGELKGDISILRTGDTVRVTALCQAVTEIVANGREANVVGTVQSITQNADGTAELKVRFADGTTGTYVANASTTVTREGSPSSLSSIRPNETVALVADGERALSIEVSSAAASTDQVYGSIYTVDVSNRIITLLVQDDMGNVVPLKVFIPYNVNIYDVASNNFVAGLNRLKENDILRVTGTYDSTGQFKATSVIREA